MTETATSSLWDVLSRMDSSDLVIVGLFVTVLTSTIAAMITSTVHRIRKDLVEVRLKERLVEQGFTAEEIEKIVRATSSDKDPDPET